MIRQCSSSGFLLRAAASSFRVPLALKPPLATASWQSLSSAASAAAAAASPSPTSIPPNLTFDRRSSFAPKETSESLLVPPPQQPPEEDDDDDESMGEPHDSGYDADDSGLDDDNQDTTLHLSHTQSLVIPLPQRLQATVHSGVDGSATGSLALDPSVFGVDPIRIDLIKRNVDYIRNKIRGRRKAKSKTISEVSGSGRKVRPQKGTGKARAGHSRPAHWRGGAKAHGPKNTVDYGDVKMNKKMRRLAMVSMLSQKLKENNLIVVDNLMLASHKTSVWSEVLEKAYGIGKGRRSSALIVDHYFEEENENDDEQGSTHASYRGVPIHLWVASNNLFKVKVANVRHANVVEILKKKKLMITLSALERMESQWKDTI